MNFVNSLFLSYTDRTLRTIQRALEAAPKHCYTHQYLPLSEGITPMPEEDPLKSQFDALKSQFFITGTSSVILYANKGTEDQTGFSLAESVGKRPGDLWGGKMPKAFYQKMWYTIQHKKTFFLNDAHNTTKQGTSFSTQTYIVPIFKNKILSHFVALTPLLQNENEKKLFETDLENIILLQETQGSLALEKIFFWLTRQQVHFSQSELSLSDIFKDHFIHPTQEIFIERETDKTLILDAQKNSQNFEFLYTKYNKKIFSYFLSHLKDANLAQDFMQETFMKALSHVGTFVPSNASYQTYLFRIAHNILVNHYRKVMPLSSEHLENVATKVPVNSLEIFSLHEGIETLTPSEKEILSLVYEQGYAMKEIAEKKNKSENAIKLQISRIRKKLRDFLDV